MRRLTRFISQWRRASIFAAACLALNIAPAGAQILGGRRPAARTAPNWIGAGIAILPQFTLEDGSTASEWRFDSNVGFMASFEHPTQSGLMIGVEGTYATPSMIYTSSAPLPAPCAGGCDATGTVTQIEALIHSGNGYSFHPVYQLTLGATGFSNFHDRAGDRIGPSSTDYDFSVAIGYGLGFGISSNIGLEAMEEIGTVLHQRTGLAAGAGGYPRLGVTRVSAKIAF